MSAFEALERQLRSAPRRWLVTGAAGFIGSNLVEALLKLGQTVVALDNFVAGHRENLQAAVALAGPEAAQRYQLIEGDIADLATCQRACEGVELVLHQAALGSVPRSIEQPLRYQQSNVTGFLTMLVAARDAKVKRFVYASSSSVYGDHPKLPKREDETGAVLSPYAATKHMNEVYAQVFERCYGLEAVGLRYFNVFGPRQDPNGAYAAVVPRWMDALARGEGCEIYGDGGTTRDFCFVANVVQANLLAATAVGPGVTGTVYNVAVGGRITLNDLYLTIRDRIAARRPEVAGRPVRYLPARAGDIRDSQADVSRAAERLGYAPTHDLSRGLDETVAYYLAKR